jgi:hypothetical protein
MRPSTVAGPPRSAQGPGGDAADAGKPPKKLTLSELENADTSTMLTSNLFLSAGSVRPRPPRSSLPAVAPCSRRSAAFPPAPVCQRGGAAAV